ncbi:7-dimethylallyltryptophan synthase [Favolaschia claudopus]|uniref:7-dimethylallyltryptophan synthase n=1 Tax=Favolaschia claudopus TaxID=2862362 RepID=A0AAW0D5I0_9AGAR
MLAHYIDHKALFADGRFFAQLPIIQKFSPPLTSLGVVDTVLCVTKQLLGGSHQICEDISVNEDGNRLQVYEILTQALPVLSEQSKFYWERAARTLASMLDTAKYPIHAQTAHLVFWWARLGGLNGPTVKGTSQEHLSEFTRDGSCVEFSWVIPTDTEPDAPCNRKIRFGIQPFHPVDAIRLSGAVVIDWLWSAVGGMGLVSQEGGKDWKDKIEKWIFPKRESDEQVVPGSTYFIAVDLEPSGSITLKYYCMPPLPDPSADPQFESPTGRLISDLTPFKPLVEFLDPSLVKPLEGLIKFLNETDSGLSLAGVACDLKPLEDNRLKLYMWTPNQTLKHVIENLTLGGKLHGQKSDDDIAAFKTLYKNLFPYAVMNETVELKDGHEIDDVPEAYAGKVGRHTMGMVYYFELFVGEPNPYPKVYFLMDLLGKNDLDTAQNVESFFKEVGKPGQPGWLVNDIARAHPHRDLAERTGTQTGFSFGIKPKGWDITGYYSPEVFRAAEKEKRRQNATE